MTDDDKSLGDDATLGGESPEQGVDAQSLGDQSTHGDHSQMDSVGDSVGDSPSLGEQLTFAGEGAGEAVNDDMEIVNLESRYTIERVLGKGGMGEVLLATDRRLERKVSIKRILAKLVGSAKAYQRFLTGAQTIAALNHPNIVQLHDFGLDSGGPFMILEYVSGGSLLDRCRQGPIPLEEAINITCQLCDGLAKAHDAGITHRDIKPANVLMTEDGIPKLTDFDLAKGEVADTGMTMAGAVLGTLDFMPPEQRKDATQVDARSDLWSLAATLYQMVTGETPRVIDLDAVPRELRSCLAQALKTNKDDRYQSAVELGTALHECLTASGNLPVTELGAGECPSCHTRNDASRKFCNECAGPLRAPCFGCESEIPVWDKVCGECGFKQQERIQELREERAKQRAEVEQLLQASEFDKAKQQTAVYRKGHDRRVEGNNAWADEFDARIDEKRESEQQRIVDIMAEAKSHQQAFDYASALTTLKQVPIVLVGESVPGHQETPLELVEELKQTTKEIGHLNKLVQRRLAIKEYDGLLEIVEQLQVLQPNRAALNRLHDQLTGREEKRKAVSEKQALSATTFYEQRDYDESLRQIGKIPARFSTPEIKTLQQRASDKKDQIDQLGNQIERQYQGENFQGLMELVEEYLELQPGAEGMLELREQLVERDRELRATRDEALTKALQFMASHDYDSCLTQINGIDDSLLVADIAALKKKAITNRDQLNRLGNRIKLGQYQGESFQGRMSDINEYLELQPGDEGMLQRREQLVERYRELRATRDEALAKALEFMACHDYDSCLQQITRIDDSLLDWGWISDREDEYTAIDIRELKKKAITNRDQLNQIGIQIQQQYQSENFQGLMSLVQEYLDLQPGNQEMLELREQLVERDKRNTALIAETLQQAQQLRQSCRFDEAVRSLEPITTEMSTEESVALLVDCELLADLRENAFDKMKRASETGEFFLGVATANRYRIEIHDSSLTDTEFELAFKAFQQLRMAKIETAQRRREFRKKWRLAAATLVTVVVLIFFVLWIQSSMRSSAIAAALKRGDYATALEMDPDHSAALAMKIGTEIKQALAKGDYQAALGLDPSNAEALGMKEDADIEQYLSAGKYQAVLALDPNNTGALLMKMDAEKAALDKALLRGDYQAALDLDRYNNQAQVMKQEADIKKALAKGDYRTVLTLDPKNVEAVAMKKKAMIEQALAQEDYRAVLALDPNNADANSMKQADIKQALAKGDYRAVLALDLGNAEALAMRKEANIKQALEKGNYKTVLGLDPHNAEALAMKKEAELKRALAMKKEADIKQALAKGDYQAVLGLDPHNAEALAMKKEAELKRALAMKKEADIKQALAKGDYQAVLGLDPNNAEAVAMKKAHIKQALAKGDYQAVLGLDPNNAEAVAMKKAHIKQALAKGDYQAVLGLDPNNAEAITMKNEADLKQAVIAMQNPTTLAGHNAGVLSVAFSPDGKTLASACSDHTIELWDIQNRTERKTLVGHTLAVFSVTFSPDGKTLASGSWDKTIKLWDIQNGTERKTLVGHSGNVISVTFSPDGKTLASGSLDKTIKLWDIESGKERNTLSGHTSDVYCVAFSPDGKTIASGSGDNTIRLWDVESRVGRILWGHQKWVYGVAFSPDGKTLASGSGDHTIKLWDIIAGVERSTLRGHKHLVSKVAFSPDGKTLVSGQQEAIILWNVQSGEELNTLKGHTRTVNSVGFSPDGQWIASGSDDKSIKLWKVGPYLDTLDRIKKKQAEPSD